MSGEIHDCFGVITNQKFSDEKRIESNLDKNAEDKGEDNLIQI
jgi:hypothetical protein